MRGTVLDIGGQDSKAIALFANGKVKKFEMNDRCAAGTGKFLEIMARTLGFAIDEFGREALLAEKDLNISSMCTVFAESEVTSLIAKGQRRREIARGLHASVIRRAAGMINRVSSAGDIVFTGGVAKNPCMGTLLAEKLGRAILTTEDPQLVGALGGRPAGGRARLNPRWKPRKFRTPLRPGYPLSSALISWVTNVPAAAGSRLIRLRIRSPLPAAISHAKQRHGKGFAPGVRHVAAG